MPNTQSIHTTWRALFSLGLVDKVMRLTTINLIMKYSQNILVAVACLLLFANASHADSFESDVIIYGGTSAAVTAAVQVANSGHSVIVVSPDKHLGGLSSGGLGWTDSGSKSRDWWTERTVLYRSPQALSKA